MRRARYWIVFAVACAGWLTWTLFLPPSMSGVDVFIFRDAGWNLASWGSFESAGLLYMRDLTPRFYSHYPPVMPLLFAGYAAIFPHNAYAGTVFNLLVGLLAAGVILACVLRQPASRLRDLTALAVAVVPVAFITYDRPEALGLVLFCATMAVAAMPGSRPVVIGLLIAAVFLAHPFAAVASAVWVAALLLARNWQAGRRWTTTLGQVAVAGGTALAALAPVALLYYALDHESLARFAAHSLGLKSGLGRAIASPSKGGFLSMLRFAAFNLGFPEPWTYVLSVASGFLLAGWAVARRQSLTVRERLPIGAGLLCMFLSIALFPIQANYILLLAFLIPAGLLIAAGNSGALPAAAMALLLWAMAINSAVVALNFMQRMEQAASYRAAAGQPHFLLTQLPSVDAIVALEGDSYDLFKPEFHHLIRVDESEDEGHFAMVAAVANCYDAFSGPAGAVRPFPEKLDAAEFHLIQPDPQHMWVTLLGHRVMRSQWGYGCDLYVRNKLDPGGAASQRLSN